MNDAYGEPISDQLERHYKDWHKRLSRKDYRAYLEDVLRMTFQEQGVPVKVLSEAIELLGPTFRNKVLSDLEANARALSYSNNK